MKCNKLLRIKFVCLAINPNVHKIVTFATVVLSLIDASKVFDRVNCHTIIGHAG